MKRFTCLAILLIFLSAWGLHAQEIIKTTAQDRQTVQLVIYNQNFALVREVRQVLLPIGESYLYIENIPAKIEPESVIGQSLFTPEDFVILSQSYHYDLITSKNLLDKYVGKHIQVYFENPFTGRKELADALLLSTQDGPICAIDGKVFLHCPGEVILPQLPQGLFPVPTLVWYVRNTGSEDLHLFQLSYLTSGMDWQADYMLVLTEAGKGNLGGWITINNQTGSSYHQAQVSLVAGEVHKTEVTTPLYRAKAFEHRTPREVKERPFFEYHLYTLPQLLDLNNDEKKQIQFIKKENINVQEQYLYTGNNYYYRSYYDTPLSKDKIRVCLKIANNKDNNLGLPLPPGKIRVYQRDQEGNLVFIGEDKISPTPVGQEIKLAMGIAFDLTASRRQVTYRRLSGSLYEIGWEISFRNSKDRPVDITVQEDVPGDWEVLKTNTIYQKVDAHTLQFIVTVPAQSEAKVEYIVRVKD
ncbi:MAG: DUF4139 domain-containing protein [Candidatus Desulfofervidaceae bacterium]|nr:DUF4139 domain-containing protein [Candidatus Desulfofervidaceae bacterium]MDL1969803.1 hypothetical protein [Candidatus Desulfofervidaceae bacterium]